MAFKSWGSQDSKEKEEGNMELELRLGVTRGIIWFWAIIAAGGIPCMSTPFSKDGTQRRKHIEFLLELLASPLIITTEELVSDFADWDNFD